MLLLLPIAVWLSASFSAANGMFGLPRALSTPADDARTDGSSECRLERTVTSGTFDEYFALADVGNRPCERHSVNLSLEVTVRNRQEELAVLLSAADRSNQHPDFARTYEMRLTNVYTVLYRETHKLRAYHSPQTKLFPPGERFRLRFLIGRTGNLTVLANDDPGRTLLAIVDELPPLDLRYISLASRMNAYPVRYGLGCDLESVRDVTPDSRTAASDGQDTHTEPPATCPVCDRPPPPPPPQRCQVVVRACADNGRRTDANEDDELEQQKYYFYFNLYLHKNRKSSEGDDGRNL